MCKLFNSLDSIQTTSFGAKMYGKRWMRPVDVAKTVISSGYDQSGFDLYFIDSYIGM
jgi:hypothetical protein